MNNIYFLLTLTVILFISSCEKDITVVPQDYENRLSIQCLITPDSFPKLYLYKTIPYFDIQTDYTDLFVKNAEITITSSLGTDILQADSIYDGFYCRYNYFYRGSQLIQSDITYDLLVVENGKNYSASATTNTPKVTIDSITYIEEFQDIYGEHEGIVVHYKNAPSGDNFFRFEMNRLVDSTTYDANKINSCSGDELVAIKEIGRTIYSGKGLNDLPMSFVIEPAFKHNEDDEAFILVQSCDKNIYEFYIKLDEQRLAQANPFTEPIFIHSLQFEDAVGVFGSYATSDPVKFIFPE